MITMALQMEVAEPIKIVNKWSKLSINHYFPQFFMLITKDMIFLSFGLYQVSYICFELKQFWLGIQLDSSGSDLGFHTDPCTTDQPAYPCI